MTRHAAWRTVKEKLGVDLDENRFIPISGINEIQRTSADNREFTTVYYLRMSQTQAARLTFNADQIHALEWVPVETLEEEITSQHQDFSGSFRDLLQFYPEIYRTLKTTLYETP